jgi:hypothetical protein
MPTPNDLLPLRPAGETGSLEWWQSEAKAASDMVDKLLPKWKENLKRYRGEPMSNSYLEGWDTQELIQVNVDFYATEQKKAQLFFRTPDVQLSPKRPEFAGAVPLFQAVINDQLSARNTNAMAAVTEILMDVLCPAGIGAVKVGYQATVDGTREIPVGAMPDPTGAIDPATGQPAMIPQTATVPNVIHDAYSIERISPAKLLIPNDFTGSNYDDAAWLGFEFQVDVQTAKARWGVDIENPTDAADPKLLIPSPVPEQRRPYIKGTEIWYKASLFDPNEKHPGKLRQLVWLEGMDKPVIHQDSPAQRFDERKRLVAGHTRFPIRVCTLRYVSDWHYPPSDCQMSRVAVDEESAARTIMMQQRRRSLPLRWIDRNRVDAADIAKITRGETQAIIPLDGSGNEIIGEIARANYPRENFTISEINERDISKLWSLGANQQGVTSGGGRTATELSLIQGNVDVRMDAERTRVLDWFVSVAETLGAYLQLFADDEQYVEVLGPDGAKRLEAWDKSKIAGEFVYSVKPDSAQKVDANVDRKMKLDLYQLTANDPNVNRAELVRPVLESFNMDPARTMQPPPQPPPDKPKLNLSFKAEDLDNPMVLDILQQSGFTIDPKMLQMLLQKQGGYISGTQPASQPKQPQGQPEHPGAAEMVEPLSKHALDNHFGGGR